MPSRTDLPNAQRSHAEVESSGSDNDHKPDATLMDEASKNKKAKAVPAPPFKAKTQDEIRILEARVNLTLGVRYAALFEKVLAYFQEKEEKLPEDGKNLALTFQGIARVLEQACKKKIDLFIREMLEAGCEAQEEGAGGAGNEADEIDGGKSDGDEAVMDGDDRRDDGREEAEVEDSKGDS